ncbi:MAG: DUF4265 domain-containing protein [Nannocystaceae bacterium]|nr:DUF4265 domain-containing protein [Nannocystaceae bacterium]
MTDLFTDDDDDELVELKVALPNHALASTESLWGDGIPSEEGHYVLRCIPLFAYGLNWGDVVQASLSSHDRPTLGIDRVVRRSGHETVRLTFLRNTRPRERGPMLETLCEFGLSYEGSPAQTIAIDVPPRADFRAVMTLLRCWSDEGRCYFETGDARAEGSFDDAPAEDAAAAMQAMMTAAASVRSQRPRDDA